MLTVRLTYQPTFNGEAITQTIELSNNKYTKYHLDLPTGWGVVERKTFR